MKLIITEKPSVAQKYAQVLSVKNKKDGYIEGNGYVITWCIGHLVGLANADTYNEKYAKWKLEDLPIIPKEFEFSVLKGKEKQFKIVSNFLNNVHIDTVINACDAGREGELIFRLVYDKAKCTKPIKRLWISSMEDSAILQGFDNLKDGKDYENLYKSALCRLKADWIVGINASRLFSCLYNQNLNVGRVMSPTLATIVERNLDISSFKPKDFYTVESEHFMSNRYESEKQAEELIAFTKNNDIKVTNISKKEIVQKPPNLYNLTTLQRDANKKYGFTAQQTLEYTQSLYEKQICTYPRTDSSFITEDMQDTLIGLIDFSAKHLNLSENLPNRVNLVVNDKLVSDHHAILPTKNAKNIDLSTLPNGERTILEMLMLRVLQAISDNYVYDEIIVTCDELFTAKGKNTTQIGFKVYDNSENEVILPEFSVGDVLVDVSFCKKQGKTSPPKQFTDDTILSYMENAGRKQDIEFCGIGTPATRSGILEKLVKLELLSRKSRSILPTDKANALITILPENIKSSTTTAIWEQKLKEIELNNLSEHEFLQDIYQMIIDLVKTYDAVKTDLFESKYPIIGTCPRCNNDILDMKKAYTCSDRQCGFTLWKENRLFTSIKKTLNEQVAKDLITTGKSELKNCYSAKTGKNFNCTVVLNDTGEKFVNFKLEFGGNK